MPSELWQRIKAARESAGMHQADIAKACGVSRPAVTQWEAKDPARRNRPNIDQLKIIAKVTDTPIDYLLNDQADPTDVYRLPAPVRPEPSPQGLDIDSMLMGALQYFLSSSGLSFEFNRRYPIGATAMNIDIAHGDLIVEVKTRPEKVMDACSRLLMAEAASGRKLKKLVILAAPSPGDATSIGQTLGIDVVQVMHPEAAAKEIIARL